MYYSLTNDAINTIATSNRGTLYLGDRNRGTIFVDALDVESSVALNLYILSAGNIHFISTSSFTAGNIHFICKSSIYLQNASSIVLNGTSSNYLLFETNYNCMNYNSTLYIMDQSSICTINGAQIKYYGSDLNIYGIMNASGSSIIISEQCDASNSMLIGGHSDSYRMSLLKRELSSLYSRNLQFKSRNGRIYIAGFDQSVDNIGAIDIIAESSAIIFGNESVVFSQNTHGVTISAHDGIDIHGVNISASAASFLKFVFNNNSFDIASSSIEAASGNLIFESNYNYSINVLSLPVSLITASNITISTPIIVNRSSGGEFKIYSGHLLSCIGDHDGISLHGEYNNTLINLQSSNIIWNCRIAADRDILWLHPTCSGTNCSMYIGNYLTTSYSLSSNELSNTNSSKLILGDRIGYTADIETIFVAQIETNNVAINCLYASDQTQIILLNQSSVQSLSIISYSNIKFEADSSLLVDDTLFLQSNLLSINNGSRILGAHVEYYGGDLVMDRLAVINCSTGSIKISAQYSMQIGHLSHHDNTHNYSMSITQYELSSLYSNDLIFESTNGSIYICGIDQTQDLIGVQNGQIQFVASQSILFDGDTTIFSGNSAGGVSVSAAAGITLNKNITNYNSDTLLFNSYANSINMNQNVFITTNQEHGNIVLNGNELICTMPCSVIAKHPTSNISLNTRLSLVGDTSQDSEFHVYAGNTFKCKKEIQLMNASASSYDATINIETGDIEFNTTSCRISGDIIWLHPTQNGSMHLVDAELNVIQNATTLYLGDALSTDAIYISDNLNITQSVASSISMRCAGDIIFSSNSSFYQTVSLHSGGSVHLLNNSNLFLFNNESNDLLLYIWTGCDDLRLDSYASISSIGNGIVNIEYYGRNLHLNETSSINTPLSSLLICEQCSSRYSMQIGGSTSHSENAYNMIILQSELSRLYSRNIMFDSRNGSIHVSGFIQSQHMNGIKHGGITMRAAQYIEFKDDIVEFSQNTDGIKIVGYAGIYIDKNITNFNGTLTFEFVNNEMRLTSPSVYIRNKNNIIFDGNSIIIDSLPSGIIASHSSSNISFSMPIVLKRNNNSLSQSQFYFYTGYSLECVSPSSGIRVYGASISASILHLQSSLITLDASCKIDFVDTNATRPDTLWLHPTCDSDKNRTCIVNIGHNTSNSNHYSLTNLELNNINSSSSAIVYLGSKPQSIFIDTIYICNIWLASRIASQMNMIADNIIFSSSCTTTFDAINLELISTQMIVFDYNSSLLLTGDATNSLLLYANFGCIKNSPAAGLTIWNGSKIISSGGASITYYGADLSINSEAFVNASQSTILISERCSTNYSMRIGGGSTNYSMNIDQSELSLLFSTNIIFDSYSGSVFVSGFNQPQDMNGIRDGKIDIIASKQVVFNEDETLFAYNTNGGVNIVANDGIYIHTNITNLDDELSFTHVSNHMVIAAANVRIVNNASNINFATNNYSLIVEQLPFGLIAQDSTSNITFLHGIIVNRNRSQYDDVEFHIYVGNILQLSGDVMCHGVSDYGTRIHLSSRDLVLNANVSCGDDIIWFDSAGSDTDMYVGGDDVVGYHLSSQELNRMNASIIYIGDYVSPQTQATISIGQLHLLSYIAQIIYFICNASIEIGQTARFDLLDVHFVASDDIIFGNGSSIDLRGATNRLFLQTNYDCTHSNSTLLLCDECGIQTSGNTSITYYGGDLSINSPINSSGASITISERCSTTHSLLVGDDDRNSTYKMRISRNELSLLFTANIVFESLHGDVYISGLIQSNDMHGVANGQIQITSQNKLVIFDGAATQFSSNTNGGVIIYGENGIVVNQNISNDDGILSFNFMNGDLQIGNANIRTDGANGDIVFHSNNSLYNININTLPTTIVAAHSTSNITLKDMRVIQITRNQNDSAQFHLYVGNVLECMYPSQGIQLVGPSVSRSTINLQANDMIWDTSTCKIMMNSSSSSDLVWLHPTCSACNIYLGGNGTGNGNYSISDAELNSIVMATQIHVGDENISNIYVADINANSNVASLIRVYGEEIYVVESASLVFESLHFELISDANITLLPSSSILLNSSSISGSLFLQTNSNLYLSSSTSISTMNGATITYYGGDLMLTSSSSIINATNSSIMISERCSTRYSMAIGGSTSPSDGNTYSMNILSSQLSSLFARHIIFDSYNGSIFVSGFDETNDMSVQFIAATNNGTHQYIRFDDGATSFDDDVSVIAYNGISIDQNMTSVAGIQFEFVNNDIIISQNVHIESQQNIEFVTSAAANTSIIIDSLPVSISASSNISIGVPIILNRSANNTNRFDLFVGNRLSCESPSTGIVLKGASSFGAIINLESSLFVWDTTTCRIDVELPNQSDIIWLHPTRTTTTMYIGGDADIDALYSLSNAELNTINASMLYLGDHDTRYVSQISISNLSLLSIQNLYISSLHASGNIEFLADSETVFNAMNVNLMANNGITFDDASSLLLNADSSHNLFLEASKYCEADSSLILRRNTFIKSVGGSVIEYYGGDLIFTDSTAYMNASLSTIKLSEQCSSQYSMAIGGDSILDEYSFNLLTSNLSSLHSRNIIFESANGSMFIAGFNQSSSMNGIAGGSITFDSLNSNIVFDNHSTTFSAANDGAIKIIASNGIQIYTNITSYSASSLLFEFVHSDLIIGRAINIMSSGNIVFSTSNASVAVNSLPTSFYATSNITINVAIGIQRVYAQNYEFAMYAGDVLSCEAPLSLYGSSLYGSTINFESRRIAWNTSRCSIDADADIIWLHPISDIMYLGVDNSMYYSLTNDAINTIATSNRGTLYLGDRNRGTIFVDALDVESSVALNLYILSLNAITNDTMLSVNANAQNIFDSMNVNMFSSGHIALLASSSILLNGATSELFLQTNYGCNSNTMNSTLSICSNCSLSTLNGSRIKYYGGDISIDGSIDGSVILLSERCSTNYSMLIGGSTNYNKYAMALSKSELSNLYCKSISFDSYSGSISIAGLEQATDMNGISNGSITISAQYLSFDESSTSFSLNQDVSIIGNRGININQNVSCSTCSILFSFLQNDLVIAPDVQILIAANIDFNSTQSIYIWGLPVTLECQSNLTISTSMIVNNSASIERDSTLHLYSGNMLSCVVGIELYSNANGSTLDFESRDIDLCGITSRHTSDIIVLHSHDNSGMYIGDSCASDSYCVSNAELNMMNTSATLYLNNSVLYISTVNIAASVASSIYFVAAGNITLYSSNLLNNNVTFISGASLSLSSDSSIVNNQEIAYYGCDINLASTSVINASTLLICEKCSSKYSMLIGDYDTNDTNDYNMILSKSELSTLHGANLIFDSRNGSIHVSGDIPCDGSIQIRAATLVEFCGRHMVEFSGNNAAGITISGYAGIYVDQNITNSAGAGTLTFNFVNGDLVFGSASVYISSFNIIFNSEANKSIIINSLPAGISATSDITLDVDLLLNRSYSQHAEFTFYAGGVLLLHGILLHGEQMSDYGSTINIESSNLIWSTINITSATTSDIIWLHPTPNNSMYLGIDNSMYYSLTNAELKNIAPSLATVVLGDCTTFSNIDSININSLQLDSIAKHLDICAKQVNIMNASSINQSINVITTDSIILTDNASITSTAQLFMQTNLACQYNASKLSICDGCAIVAPNYEYYGSDLEIASSSSIIN
eukprot:741339_1